MEYTETIYMRKTWIMALVAFSIFLTGSLGIILAFAPGKNVPDFTASGILIASSLIIFLLFWQIRLKLIINKAGIYYRYFPFHLKEYFIPWETVISAQGRKYNPIKEYGGWGIKGRKSNRAYNISGSFGLQLELSDGRKLLFESRNPDEINKVLIEFKREMPLNKTKQL